jgi:hypothetical protein
VTLYDGHKEGQVKMTLKGRPLRGIHNRCMLCSEKELGLSDDHEGIMILEGDYTPGTPIQDVLGDAVLSIDIIPNIARCASIVGVAREVAALTGQKVRYPSYEVVMEGPTGGRQGPNQQPKTPTSTPASCHDHQRRQPKAQPQGGCSAASNWPGSARSTSS